MKSLYTALLATASLLSISNCALIIDRVFKTNDLAEGIPLTVTYNFYNTDDSTLFNIEAHDPHFSNTEDFNIAEGQLSFKFESLEGNQRLSKSATVIPKESKEHTFEPVTFSYQTTRDGVKIEGIAGNKPVRAEIISKREYVLKNGWSFESWGVFGVLSLISIGLPYSMWKSSSSGRQVQEGQEGQEQPSKKANSNSKKNKRA